MKEQKTSSIQGTGKMKYTLEEIYLAVGKEDKVTGVTFRNGSESQKMYGDHITVVFLYTQKERENLDHLVTTPPFKSVGLVRAKILVEKLEEAKMEKLKKEGFNSEDIVELLYFLSPEENTFHSREKRKIKKLTVNTETLPKGKDLDWMYGFKKRLVAENIGLCPRERSFYLACKFYYEPDKLTQDELNEIFVAEGHMEESVEHELLAIKYVREELSPQEKNKLVKHYVEKKRASFAILDEYLVQAGSSLKKLANENPEQAVYLFEKVLHFKDRRLNVTGRTAIYIDIHSFLHIYMRHVEEYKVNEHFENKDNFQWNEEDVLTVMEHVIKEFNNEIQKFIADNPEQRYNRYGDQSAYFEGDYYTFHVEPSGRISTFYRNNKGHEKKGVEKK